MWMIDFFFLSAKNCGLSSEAITVDTRLQARHHTSQNPDMNPVKHQFRDLNGPDRTREDLQRRTPEHPIRGTFMFVGRSWDCFFIQFELELKAKS